MRRAYRNRILYTIIQYECKFTGGVEFLGNRVSELAIEEQCSRMKGLTRYTSQDTFRDAALNPSIHPSCLLYLIQRSLLLLVRRLWPAAWRYVRWNKWMGLHG
jgi:hypothetical protein